jgi:hypothetical protein
MATSKIGQVSSNAVSDLMQQHWDLDRKIGELLTTASLDLKRKLAARLPTILSELEAELNRVEMPTA